MSSTYSSKVYRGPEGRKLTAKDIAERLLPDLSMNELLCWAPDLFAYTSYLMSVTGVYQLVVSPPKGKTWQPANNEILGWLGLKPHKTKSFADDGLEQNVAAWLTSFVRERKESAEDYKTLNQEEKEMWGLNTETWSPYKEGSYFNKKIIQRVTKAPNVSDKINAIAQHVRIHAIGV